MDTYTQRGGAYVGMAGGTWPFGKIVVQSGLIRLSVLGQSISLTPSDIVAIRTDWSGINFDYRTKMLGESARFTGFGYRRLIEALRAAGFTVSD